MVYGDKQAKKNIENACRKIIGKMDSMWEFGKVATTIEEFQAFLSADRAVLAKYSMMNQKNFREFTSYYLLQ